MEALSRTKEVTIVSARACPPWPNCRGRRRSRLRRPSQCVGIDPPVSAVSEPFAALCAAVGRMLLASPTMDPE
eukprot:2239667-Prymnesium_polylepis.1